MEMIQDVPMREPIALRHFLERCIREITPDMFPRSSADIQKLMNLDDDLFKELEESMSIKHLEQMDDVRVTPYISGVSEINRKSISQIPTDALKLKTFKNLIEEKKTVVKNPFSRTQHSFRQVKEPEPPTSPEETCKPFSELLISIRFYRPKRSVTRGGKPKYEMPHFNEEFQCLGSNLLSELRDKVACICNKKRFFDISESPECDNVDKETDPGFFFITDTFYNDTRNPKNPDYSQVIRKWAKSARGLSQLKFKIAKMEETKFIDLTVSLGFPQVYQHHGNCEHLFTFSFVEFVTPSSTCFKKELYPLLKSVNSFNTHMCKMCGQREYMYIVERSKRQLHDPAYLCSKCFYAFHYLDGKKIGEFKAYRIHEKPNLTGDKRAEKDCDKSAPNCSDAFELGDEEEDDGESDELGEQPSISKEGSSEDDTSTSNTNKDAEYINIEVEQNSDDYIVRIKSEDQFNAESSDDHEEFILL